MRRFARTLTVYTIAASLLLIPIAQTAGAQMISKSSTQYTQNAIEPSAESMAADGLVLRPAGIVGAAAGICVWVVTLPFSLLGQNVGKATQELIEEPMKYTFSRPLGSF